MACMDEWQADLRDDFDEVRTLADSARLRLEEFHNHLTQHPTYYPEHVRAHLLERAHGLSAGYEAVMRDATQERENAETWQEKDSAQLSLRKKTFYEQLRILQSELGSVLSAGNWQSPSSDHTRESEAGSDTGSINAGLNDYKRDGHTEEQRYARAFCKEYIDHPLRLAPLVGVTGSGMAAVTTALTMVAEKVKPDDVVLVGKSSYFQNRWVLEQLFSKQIIYVDEFETDNILELAREHKPALIFLDTLSNAPTIPVLNLKKLIPSLAKICSGDTTLVLDNTGLATGYQPLTELLHNPFGMRLVILESLLKYHQFGIDRACAGVLWEPRDLRSERVLLSRMHSGTIAPDVSVAALPVPNRTLLDKRLTRLSRNAQILAERIDAAARAGSKSIAHAVYPGLPTHRGYAWTKDMSFRGGFLTLAFTSSQDSLPYYDSFVTRVLEVARTQGVDLVGGTSFGFNTTRISVPARYAGDAAKPFVRIAAGTETRADIEKVAQVFEEVIRA